MLTNLQKEMLRGRTQAGYGHPEATLRPPSGHLVANR